MAEQEEPVRRRMALEVIKLGMDTKSVIARFEAGRQALAMMDHPNSAKIYDAGATGGNADFPVGEKAAHASESGGGEAADRAGWNRRYGPSLLRHGTGARRSHHRLLRPKQSPHWRALGPLHASLSGHSARAPEWDHPPRHQAVEQRNVAVEQRKLADMQLALQAWEEGDLQRANDLIDASRAAPGQVPGFEGRYLRKLCQDQSSEIFGSTNHQYRSALFFDRDLLLLNDEKTLTLHDLSSRKNQLPLEDQDGISIPAFCFGNTNRLARRS
jgi:hypothetical protein